MTRPDAPPRAAEWLLERFIANQVARVGLVGDLREEFTDRLTRHTRLACAAWYWRQALHAATRYAIEQARMERGAVMQHRHPDETEKSTMAHDVRFALRVLSRSPVLTTITILALTVGIGLPTVMFSIVNGVFRDVPIAEPERVMSLFTTDESAPGRISSVSHHDFVAWRDQLQGFSALAGFTIEDVTIGGGDVHPNREDAAFVTSGVFAVLRTQPMLGRPFRDEDAMPGASPVVMISHGLWQSRFGGDSAVITRSLVIDGREHAIVGVMRPGFVFPGNEPIWIPLALSTTGPREDASTLSVVGRLREGGSLEAVRAELAVVAGRLAAAYPESNRGRSATARPYGEGIVAPVFTRGLFTMLGAVSLVLLIACINVAHLALARAIHRSREIAVRTAMGASRRRVVSQFFVESLIVTMVGGVLGTIAAAVGAHAVGGVVVSAAGVPWGDPGLDGTVLMFVLAAVIVSSVLAAVLPALHAARLNVNAVLKDAPRGVAGGGAGIGRFGRWLVVAEIAASCALLAVSGLLIKGVLRLNAIDLGMPAAEIVTGEVELPREVYTTGAERTRLFDELERSVQSIPGVRAAALMSDIPGTISFGQRVTVEGSDEPTPRVAILAASPAFLDVLDKRVLDGRVFDARDRAGSEPVVIVNRRFAELYMAGRRAVGQSITLGSASRTVIGVAPDLLMGSMDQPGVNGPGLYVPLAQTQGVSMQLMARTTGDPMSIVSSMRAAVESLDPNLALMDVGRVDRLIAREAGAFQVIGAIFLVSGLIALFLAAIGLYGVMAFTMRQRTLEGGIRMALGATRGNVVGSAMREGSRQLAIGLGIGIVTAGMLSTPLSRFFYQVQPWDPAVFSLIVLILGVTSLVAILVPAHRASRSDPMAVLRQE